MAVTLGELIVELAANTARFEGDLGRAATIAEARLKNIKDSAEKFLGAVVVEAAAAGAALYSAFSSGVQNVDDIKKFSEQLGLSVDQMAKLQYAAKATGTDIDTFRTSVRALEKEYEAALGGSIDAQRKFDGFGVSLRNTDGSVKTTSQLLAEFANKFSSYTDGAIKSADANLIFGKSGNEFLPFLDQGAVGLDALSKRAGQLGVTLSKADTEGVQAFKQSMNDLQSLLTVFQNKLAVSLAPVLSNYIKQMTDSADATSKIDKAVEAAASGVKILVSAFTVLSGVLQAVGQAYGGQAAILDEIVHGKFKAAYETMKAGAVDVVDNIKATLATVASLWATPGAEIAAKSEENANAIAAPIIRVAEIVQTYQEEIAEQLLKLNDKVAEQAHRDAEQAGSAAAAILDRQAAALAQNHVHLWDQLQDIADQGAKGIQQSMEDFFFDPFSKGLNGLLQSFTTVIRRMIAQALAAQLMKNLFGLDSSGGSGLGNIFGQLLTTGAFGGGKASGGAVSPGSTYLVGENGPELLTMGSSGGNITPNGGGGGAVTIHNHIDARGADAERIMRIMPTLLAQTAEKSKRDILDSFRRHGLAAPRSA